MESIIITPRLKLTLITKAERGTPEFEWLHIIRSDEKATWWSIHGRAKSAEDTEKAIKGFLPNTEGQEKTYRVVYAVHEIIDTTSNDIKSKEQPTGQVTNSTEFIGMVALKSLDAGSLALPEDLLLPGATSSTTLIVELAYSLLPSAWSKGYATESVNAVLESCNRTRSFWMPFSNLYIRAIVNEGNPMSMRVMDKIGMVRSGIYEWTGRIFLAGEWRERDNLHIFGRHLFP